MRINEFIDYVNENTEAASENRRNYCRGRIS